MTGKKAARSSSKKAGRPAGKKTKAKRTWNRYVLRVLKQVNVKGVTISARAMAVVNSFVNDIFDKVAVEAASVARNNKVKTVSSRAVQAAVRLALPGDLAKHAMAEGTKSLAAVAK
jgi:histone H2B